jgi:hypothetical protein
MELLRLAAYWHRVRRYCDYKGSDGCLKIRILERKKRHLGHSNYNCSISVTKTSAIYLAHHHDLIVFLVARLIIRGAMPSHSPRFHGEHKDSLLYL